MGADRAGAHEVRVHVPHARHERAPVRCEGDVVVFAGEGLVRAHPRDGALRLGLDHSAVRDRVAPPPDENVGVHAVEVL